MVGLDEGDCEPDRQTCRRVVQSGGDQLMHLMVLVELLPAY